MVFKIQAKDKLSVYCIVVPANCPDFLEFQPVLIFQFLK